MRRSEQAGDWVKLDFERPGLEAGPAPVVRLARRHDPTRSGADPVPVIEVYRVKEQPGKRKIGLTPFSSHTPFNSQYFLE
jgi:hypothetical protein